MLIFGAFYSRQHRQESSLPVHGPPGSRSMAMPLKACKGPHCKALPDPLCRRLQGMGVCAVHQPSLYAWPLVLSPCHAQVKSCIL